MSEIANGLFLLVILVPTVILVVRFFYWLIDRNLKDLARVEGDDSYRQGLLAELDAALARSPEDANLRRRRADARRFDGDHAGVIEDLTVYLKARPADDAGWAELAESLTACGQYEDALAATAEAIRLDPAYIDYQAACAQAALLAGRLEAADAALAAWARQEEEALATEAECPRPRQLLGRAVPPRQADRRLCLYRGALALARMDPDTAATHLAEAREMDREAVAQDLAEDPALRALQALHHARR